MLVTGFTGRNGQTLQCQTLSCKPRACRVEAAADFVGSCHTGEFSQIGDRFGFDRGVAHSYYAEVTVMMHAAANTTEVLELYLFVVKNSHEVIKDGCGMCFVGEFGNFELYLVLVVLRKCT